MTYEGSSKPMKYLFDNLNIHVYSTSEKIVGKWIDDTDAYEKTITYIPSSSGSISLNLGISYDTIIDVRVFAKQSDKYTPITDYSITNGILSTTLTENMDTLYVTIQYTKEATE